MNNKRIINLKNKNIADGRFIFAKNMSGEQIKGEGEAYIIDLKYSNIKKFLRFNNIKLIKRVSNDELIIVTGEKDYNLFSHIKMDENRVDELYSKKYIDKDENIENILVGKTNTFVLDDVENKTIAYNSDLKAKLKADRIEKKKVNYNGKELVILDCTDYLKKGSISDTVEYYINPEDFTVKGFYSKVLNRVGFYFGKENSDIKGFNFSVDGDLKEKDSIKFIKMYDDTWLSNDEEYKKLTDDGEKLEYRFRKTYENEIIKYINVMHQLEKIDSENDERLASKVLTKKLFERVTSKSNGNYKN